MTIPRTDRRRRWSWSADTCVEDNEDDKSEWQDLLTMRTLLLCAPIHPLPDPFTHSRTLCSLAAETRIGWRRCILLPLPRGTRLSTPPALRATPPSMRFDVCWFVPHCQNHSQREHCPPPPDALCVERCDLPGGRNPITPSGRTPWHGCGGSISRSEHSFVSLSTGSRVCNTRVHLHQENPCGLCYSHRSGGPLSFPSGRCAHLGEVVLTAGC